MLPKADMTIDLAYLDEQRQVSLQANTPLGELLLSFLVK
jgi:tRNA threonylcarbamoyladenosine biosynthesis protein TsaE